MNDDQQLIEDLKHELHRLKSDPDPLRLNGKRKGILWGTGATVFGTLSSMITFWAGFFPTLATEDFVKTTIDEALVRAPATPEARLRLTALEQHQHTIEGDLRDLSRTLYQLDAKMRLFPLKPNELR